MRTFAIVNVTRDSFSDGGRYLAPSAAIAHGERLLAAGADVLDLGAESTHPDAEDVPAADELARLVPVVRTFVARGVAVSVDTRKPAVMAGVLPLGVRWLNDVTGFRSPAAMEVVATAPRDVGFVAMFARSPDGRARENGGNATAAGLLEELRAFCRQRVAAFAAAGIGRDRLVLDPGMGFFLGSGAEASLVVLRELPALQREFGPLLVSVSRKSFLGAITGLPVAERWAPTLAAELWAARAGVSWIRTHDVQALRAAWATECAIAATT